MGASNLGAVLGVDVGGTNIKWVRWSEVGGVEAAGQVATPRGGESEVVGAVVTLVTEQGGRAVGVGMPGHLTVDGRRTRLIPNIAGDWDGFPLADVLEARLQLPVTLGNDARAFARAELEVGSASDLAEALFVTIGTGIGGAVAIGGEIIRGGRDALGEFGHMICETPGALCGCGAFGCLETIASGSALVARARALSSEAFTSEGVVRAAALSEGPERQVLREAGRALGFVLGNLMAVFGISAVIVGGGAAPALDWMRPTLDAELATRRVLVGPVDLRLATLGNHAGAVGAALGAADTDLTTGVRRCGRQDALGSSVMASSSATTTKWESR
jgi:glucokinase